MITNNYFQTYFWDFKSDRWENGPRLPDALSYIDFSTTHYDKYIFVVFTTKIYWLDVEAKSSWLTKDIVIEPKGFLRVVGFVGNFYGYPAILAIGGARPNEAAELWSTSGNILLLEDLSSADGISVHQLRDFGLGHFKKGKIQKVNDEVFIIQGYPTNRPGTAGKDILIWNYHEGRPELRGQYSEWRTEPNAIVVSGKYFRTCLEDNIRKLTFKKKTTHYLQVKSLYRCN